MFWRALDWRAAWLAPYVEIARPVIARLEAGACTAAALGAPRFVAQAELPAREPYEAFIARTGHVPTRDNLHDLLNGLVWLRFPALKQRLNALHAAQLAEEGVQPRRGPLRDALTLFDENGAWWQAPPPLADALRRRDWHALFVGHRALWNEAQPVLIGHALLEKLAVPRPPITAHVWLAGAALDDAGAPAAITADAWARKPFHPLPVLGVPGWWPANDDAAFYDDASVFRPPRG
jgi:hypothetical protein